MKTFARTTALTALLVAAGFGVVGTSFAQDAMSPAPMASDAMASDAMTPDAMEKCHTDAMAQTDTTKQNQMLADCNAMALDATAPDAMAPDAMAPDAMTPDAMAPTK